MRMKEICQACGITRKALAWYEAQGLVQPHIQPNGYRLYTAADAERLRRIATLRGLGLSTEEIRRSLADPAALGPVLAARRLEREEEGIRLALMEALACTGDWAAAQRGLDSLNKRRTVTQLLLEKFPGSFGQYVALHFAPYLNAPITTSEQQAAFDTAVAWLDGVSLEVPDALCPALAELDACADPAWMQQASAEVAEAVQHPEDWLRQHGDAVRAWRELSASPAWQASPQGQLQALLRQWAAQSGYNEVFLPAMERLSPAYRAYRAALRAAEPCFEAALADQP